MQLKPSKTREDRTRTKFETQYDKDNLVPRMTTRAQIISATGSVVTIRAGSGRSPKRTASRRIQRGGPCL